LVVAPSPRCRSIVFCPRSLYALLFSSSSRSGFPSMGKEKVAARGRATNPLTGLPYSKRYHTLQEKRKALPVWALREKLLDALSKHQTVVVAGDPGSGKSTQVPQFVLEAGYACDGKQIACTQPRRVVATTIASRVAEEMDVKLGEEVGYSVRFESCSGPKTVLKYLTDGILLREAISDRFLECYRVIILDEAHLRTLATDILLGFLNSLLKIRKDLKVVVLASTSEAKRFQAYFQTACTVKIPRAAHYVEIVYESELVEEYVEASIEKIRYILSSEPSGDILVFLTGVEEINRCSWRLTKVIANLGDRIGPVKVVSLHSTLCSEMQKKVFKGAGPPLKKGGPPGRRIILSTDIAESSLAIDGITYVIDSGFSKQKVYNPFLNVESLLILPISKPSAYWRAGGCARRSQPGKCFRLYTKEFFRDFHPPQISPEILRANLASTILVLNKLGISDLFHFGFIDPPPAEAVARGIETLNYLDALDADGTLTKMGELMSEFPLDPQMSKMIVSSPGFHCSNEILSIAAMLSVPHCFLQPIKSSQAGDEAKARYNHVNGDHLTLLNIFQSYVKCDGNSLWCKENFVNEDALKSAVKVRNQLQSIMCKLNLPLCSTELSSSDCYDNIRKCILTGYFMQAARLEDSGHYGTLKDNHVVDLHPSCCLTSKPAWAIYYDFVVASRNFIRTVTDVKREWLIDIAPHYYQISITQGATSIGKQSQQEESA
ncbi:hypothetical protein Taro_042489, partial [Colocasia esculenta]|nr:hypothetical protein [Colocasia esculenta]